MLATDDELKKLRELSDAQAKEAWGPAIYCNRTVINLLDTIDELKKQVAYLKEFKEKVELANAVG